MDNPVLAQLRQHGISPAPVCSKSMELAWSMDLPTWVRDSDAKTHQTHGGGRERQGRTLGNGEDRRDQLGVWFKRAPVAPTIFDAVE